MIVLAFGGASSGKSRFAERVACELAQRDGLPLDYLATMQPYGEAGRERVERHRAMRAGKGFATVECYGSLDGARLGALSQHDVLDVGGRFCPDFVDDRHL